MTRIGIPREIKPFEGRVGLVPAACAELVHRGHEVFVEMSAGVAGGFDDAAYRQAGAAVLPDSKSVYEAAQLIVKVKEPVAGDLPHLRSDHLLFCFLHLAAVPELGKQLCDIGLTAVAFETVRDESGGLPLLAPMSDIAGRVAVQTGAHLLHRPQGGKGLLLGGLPAAPRGRVTVIGAGVVGMAAAEVASGLGAEVTIFDLRRERLAAARALGTNVTALHPFRHDLETSVIETDLLVGAVLVPGRRTPRIVPREWIARMAPGSVIVDVSVDQGGCIETTRPMSYVDPPYVDEGVLHWCVTNMPGGVPRTASTALSAVLAPFVLRLAEPGWETDPRLVEGINIRAGEYVNEAVRTELG